MKIKSLRFQNRVVAMMFVLAGLGWLLTGCATTKKTGPQYVFFPPAPDEPRIQFLTAYSSEKDLRGGTGSSFMRFVTGEQLPDNPIFKPYGAAVADGAIYLCDTSISAILRLDLATKKLSMISPRGAGALGVPVNLAWGGDGTIYVADSSRNQVIILNTNGDFVGVLCEKNKNQPRDVALTADRVYVGDVQTHNVHVFDRASRKLLMDIPSGTTETDDKTKLFQPANIALDEQGRLYVSDIGAYRVQVYDRDGKYLRTIGSYGDNVGEFARPKGVALDRRNWVYVADAAEQVVQMFNDTGRLLMWFGEPKASLVGLQLPSKVVIDYDNTKYFEKYVAPGFKLENLIVVINQTGTRKVSVFGYIHKN
jgi:DNA-binding beta-propeller fold protein YncE